MDLNVYIPNLSLKITEESVTMWLILKLFIIMDIICAIFIRYY